MARTLSKSKGRRSSGTFSLIPHAVMDSEDFRTLSGSALKVLFCLVRQYRGKNNGDLSATLGQVNEWGVSSTSTLSSVLKELEAHRLIVKTREGRFLKPGGCCALFALSWHPIDECDGKLEVNSTLTAPRKFSLERATHERQKPPVHASAIEKMAG